MINIIGRKNIFLSIALILVGAAVVSILTFGLRQGTDLRGGVLLQFSISGDTPAVSEVQETFHSLGLTDARISYNPTDNIFVVRYSSVTDPSHSELAQALKDKYPSWEELSFQTTSPSIGKELRRKSLIAIVLALLGVSLYIAFAFRKVYRPVSSWKYGIVTLVTLFHDVAIPTGLLAMLGRHQGVEIDGNFVVALLVIMGFSVHDTIVVFDRIRENLLLDRGKTSFGEVVNASVNQTMARSINTSLTLIFVLLALYLAGPATLKYFILTLIVGVSVGVYSSIFVASPLLYVWQRLSTKS